MRELQRFYRRKLVQKGLGKARVAVARKLGIRLWIMLRDQIDYQEFCRRGQKHSGDACAGMLETRFGANGHRPVDWATRLPSREGSSHNSSWSEMTEEMVGGQHRRDEATRKRACWGEHCAGQRS